MLRLWIYRTQLLLRRAGQSSPSPVPSMADSVGIRSLCSVFLSRVISDEFYLSELPLKGYFWPFFIFFNMMLVNELKAFSPFSIAKWPP